MTAQLIAVHKVPQDPDQYLAYYDETHLPLALRLPGLKKYEMNKGAIDSGGGDAILQVAILYFDSMADLEAALKSPEGVAAIDDLPKFAASGNIQMLAFETRDVPLPG